MVGKPQHPGEFHRSSTARMFQCNLLTDHKMHVDNCILTPTAQGSNRRKDIHLNVDDKISGQQPSEGNLAPRKLWGSHHCQGLLRVHHGVLNFSRMRHCCCKQCYYSNGIDNDSNQTQLTACFGRLDVMGIVLGAKDLQVMTICMSGS